MWILVHGGSLLRRDLAMVQRSWKHVDSALIDCTERRLCQYQDVVQWSSWQEDLGRVWRFTCEWTGTAYILSGTGCVVKEWCLGKVFKNMNKYNYPYKWQHTYKIEINKIQEYLKMMSMENNPEENSSQKLCLYCLSLSGGDMGNISCFSFL